MIYNYGFGWNQVMFAEEESRIEFDELFFKVTHTTPSPYTRWFTDEGFNIFMSLLKGYGFGFGIYPLVSDEKSADRHYFSQVSKDEYVFMSTKRAPNTLIARAIVSSFVKEMRSKNGWSYNG